MSDRLENQRIEIERLRTILQEVQRELVELGAAWPEIRSDLEDIAMCIATATGAIGKPER